MKFEVGDTVSGLANHLVKIKGIITYSEKVPWSSDNGRQGGTDYFYGVRLANGRGLKFSEFDILNTRMILTERRKNEIR